jgi:hypothetical protein
MGIEFNKGFFIFDKSWIQENEFMHSLSHAEYRIMIYLLSSTLKISKKDSHYKRGDMIAHLYQFNHILFANVSQRTIADRCNVNRLTVMRSLRMFEDYGAVITLSDGENNNFYIIGFETKDKLDKQEYYLIDSMPIRSGKRMPEEIKNTIIEHYKDELFGSNDFIWRELFGMKQAA